MSGTSNRITIQLDLSGYSFKIYDRSGNILSSSEKSCPIDLAVNELSSEIDSNSQVSVELSTWKYTMVPLSSYESEHSYKLLNEIKDIEPTDRVLTLELPSRKAKMIFAVNGDIYEKFMALAKNTRFYPVAYTLLERLDKIEQNNRVVISFSEGMLHIAVAERDRLLFVNTFPTRDIATTEYFVMSVIKELTFNPEHTDIHILGNVEDAMVANLRKYFPNVLKMQ